MVASVIAALYYAGRLGFDNPVRPVATTLGLSLFITVAPFLVWRFSARGHYHEPQPWWRSQTALTIAAIAITALAGMLVPATGLNLAPVLAAIGIVSAIAALVIWIRQGQQLANLIFLVGSAGFAVWACGVAWSTRYKNPVFWETLEYRADVHHDPLYYVSMANNMRAYGVPSTGIDGVPYTPYHYGSAWLNSQWAYLTGTDVLAFYSLGPSVIVIPLFFAAILLLAVEVKKNWSVWPDLTERPLKTDYAAWLFFLAVSIGVIPTSGLDAMGIWNRHAMISESYVIAVPVFLLTIATAIAYWRRKRTSLSSGDLVFSAPVRSADAGSDRIPQGLADASASMRRPWSGCTRPYGARPSRCCLPSPLSRRFGSDLQARHGCRAEPRIRALCVHALLGGRGVVAVLHSRSPFLELALHIPQVA